MIIPTLWGSQRMTEDDIGQVLSTGTDTHGVIIPAGMACLTLGQPSPGVPHPGSVLPRAREWVVLRFPKPNHFGLCFVQSPGLSFSPCSRERLHLARSQRPLLCDAALPGPTTPACSAAGREAPAAGDSCPWAVAKPHRRAGQGSALPGNPAEWAGGWQGGGRHSLVLRGGSSGPPHSRSPFLLSAWVSGRLGGLVSHPQTPPHSAQASPGQPNLSSVI